MILHDISRDALTTPVFEGDPPTEVRQLQSMDEMDVCNLTAVSMTTHAGTHIDAPLHFWEDGQSIDMLRLNTFYGKCTVIAVQGVLTGADTGFGCLGAGLAVCGHQRAQVLRLSVLAFGGRMALAGALTFIVVLGGGVLGRVIDGLLGLILLLWVPCHACRLR